MPARLAALSLLALILGLPLLGALLAGHAPREFLAFPPPLRIPVNYPRWSWFACAGVAAPFVAFAWAWWRARRERRVSPSEASPLARALKRPFPWWGVVALVLLLACWLLAWTRFAWFEPLQRYTFFPLWLSFIVAMNALTFSRTGTCLMIRAPRAWLGLFAASAVFWWMFEWLNRFVHNWHYLGVEDTGPVDYAVHATLCFSTVLPAVAAVREWIGTHREWETWFAVGPAFSWLARPITGAALIAGGVIGLVATGVWPLQFYPALWSAPLALLLGESILSRRAGAWQEMARGNWRNAAAWAIAGLLCGLCWELWNVHSVAKWIYTVPYVDRGHIFEMPVLGYLGYLPFGIECLLVVERLAVRLR
jgi:hypothetical protein